MAPALLLAALLGTQAPGMLGASPQTGTLRLETVFPRLAGKNHVRWWSFDWRHVDFHPVEGGAAVRLYFYENERTVAQLAKAFTTEAYRDFVRVFGYTPSRRIPYLVYNSHVEFESTNAFFVSEHVLGVTSTVDLTMALPYWGEHRRFVHVMRHELAHQFTIQLVRDRTARLGCNALEKYPLWFIEGIAQFFALEGRLTGEVRTALADRLLDRPDSRRGGLPRFFAEGPLSFERIYLVGHAQVVFLEETGGAGTVRMLLDAATRMCGAETAGNGKPVLTGFAQIVGERLGLAPDTIEERWRAWVGDKMAPQIAARQPMGLLPKLTEIGDGEIDAYALGPDRRTIFYRTMDRQTGRARLFLQDLREPGARVKVSEDERLGLVSFHPGGRRVTAVGDGVIAYIGRADASDVLFVRRYERRRRNGRLELSLGPVTAHDLWRSHGLIEMGDPAVRPSDGAVAFVGLDQRSGFLDVFVVEDPLRVGAAPRPITDDPYAERELAFDARGGLLYLSDGTPHGGYALFRLPAGTAGGTDAARQLLAFADNGEIAEPHATADGTVYFSAAPVDVPQIHALRVVEGAPAAPVALTDVATALRSPAIDDRGDLIAIAYEAGQRFMVRVPHKSWRSDAVAAALAPAGAPRPLPLETAEARIADESDYAPYNLRNYRVDQLFAFGGTGPFLLGFASVSDILRDHVGGIQIEVLGSFRRTNGMLFFIDRSGRFGFGGAAFVRTGVQLLSKPADLFAPIEGFLLQRAGASAILEYPFGFYTRLELFGGPQAVRALDFTDPTTDFARQESRTRPAFELGGRLTLDTLRMAAPVGPTDGVSVILETAATQRFRQESPFGTAAAEISAFRSLSPSDRFYLFVRLAGGTGFGGRLAEQFYVPPVYNNRAYPEGSFDVFGRGYYLATAELRFPLDALIPFIAYVEGVLGGDFGAVVFDWKDGWRSRVGASVVGLNFGLAPFFEIRLHFARPFDVGSTMPADEWLTHLAIMTPFLFF